MRDRFQEIEIVDLDRLHVAHRPRHPHDRRREIDVALRAVKAHCDSALRLDARELLEEIDMEISTAVFAVGDTLEPDVFLELHYITDRCILYFAQPFARKL